MDVKKVLSIRRYKAGYEIREELIDDSMYGGDGFTTKTAYTPSGDYIGEPKLAHTLCKKMGIAPEKISSDHNVCSIGFCEKNKKWAGWSHRGLYMFGIGSKTKKGDCGFTPRNVLELYASLSSDERERVVGVDVYGITIEDTVYSSAPVNPDDPKCDELKWVDPKISYYTIEVGRGEWEAKTLDEAKKMAIDFARGIS